MALAEPPLCESSCEDLLCMAVVSRLNEGFKYPSMLGATYRADVGPFHLAYTSPI
jgi:hypothetical protein